MKAVILAAAFFMLFQGHANATSVSVPTTITNAPKAQFIGSMVTANNDNSGSKVIRQAVTPLNPQFKDCTACRNWLDDQTTGLVAKFVGGNSSAPMAASWAVTGYIGIIGKCVDSLTGYACPVAE